MASFSSVANLDCLKLKRDKLFFHLYEGKNRLQELVQVLARKNKTEELRGVRESMEKSISGKFEIIETIAEGKTQAFKVRFEDGTLGVYKPDIVHEASDSLAEVAAYKFDKMMELGLVPPTKIVNGPNGKGSVQYFVNKTTDGGKSDVFHYGTFKDVKPDCAKGRSGLRNLAFFDYLINNLDRHGGNVLCAGSDFNQIIIAIDHGTAFKKNKNMVGVEQHIPLVSPVEFPWPDPAVIQRLQSLSRRKLEKELKGLVSPNEIERIWLKRKTILEESKVWEKFKQKYNVVEDEIGELTFEEQSAYYDLFERMQR
jgi:hypothetical protein